jgi:phage gpG-like protein
VIRGSVVGGERVTASLKAMTETMAGPVGRVVGEFGLDVVNAAKRNAPLKTGRLRRSIHLELFNEPGQVLGVVGSNVEYAARIENGFKGTESVREFVRKQTMAWGRPITPQLVSVRPFTRRVNVAARSFLAPALADTRPTLTERLKTALAGIPGFSA